MTKLENIEKTHQILKQNLNSETSYNLESGLSQKEILTKQKLFGKNVIEEYKKISPFYIFANQFLHPLIYILFVACVLSIFLGDLIDGLAILTIIILNGCLGFFQEYKAENALESLQNLLSPKAVVIRDSKEQNILAENLVPGDLIVLSYGDKIPADVIITQSTNLEVDESILTGESIPVAKSDITSPDANKENNLFNVWMGTHITSGEAKGIVQAIGQGTHFGKISKLTQKVHRDKTPLQKRLEKLSKQLGITAIVLSIIIALIGIITGKEYLEMFFTSLSLAVAIVPEGLPTVVTITLALGIRIMSKKNALIRRLQSAETLGSVTTICTDKTGTITQNQMTIREIQTIDNIYTVTGTGYTPNGELLKNNKTIDPQSIKNLSLLIEAGYHCNHASIQEENQNWIAFGKPTEAALVTLYHKAFGHKISKQETVFEIPFTSKRKLMTVVKRINGTKTAYVKGASEYILKLCTKAYTSEAIIDLPDIEKDKILQKLNKLESQGMRVLALAYKELNDEEDHENHQHSENNLCFLGLVGIIDPPRPEIQNAIQLSHKAGIKVLMITGDSKETAQAIANNVGIKAKKTLVGNEIEELSDSELRNLLKEEIIFARTTPEHKLKIVKALQENGEIVAMTGDGVNDAPALKKSNIGISMGIRGTDVAKSSSDIILLDDNFASIIKAVKEGRRQYNNIRKFVHYLLSSNLGEVIAILFAILSGLPLIFLPIQILWMNLITDGFTALSLGVDPADSETMNKPPRNPNAGIISRNSFTLLLFIGSTIGLLAFFIFYYFLNYEKVDIIKAQTVAFTTIIFLEKINVFNYKSLSETIFKSQIFNNIWVILAVVFTLSLQVLAIYTPQLQKILHTVPLNLRDWFFIITLSFILILFAEFFKILIRKEE